MQWSFNLNEYQYVYVCLIFFGIAQDNVQRARFQFLPGRFSHSYGNENDQNSDSNEGIKNQAEAICLLGAEANCQVCSLETHLHLIELESQAEVLDVHQGHNDGKYLTDQYQVPHVHQLQIRSLGDGVARLGEESSQHQHRCQGHHNAVLRGGKSWCIENTMRCVKGRENGEKREVERKVLIVLRRKEIACLVERNGARYE